MSQDFLDENEQTSLQWGCINLQGDIIDESRR